MERFLTKTIISLNDAILEGNFESVSNLVNSPRVLNSISWSDGYFLLHDAIVNNHTEIAKLILTNINTEIDSKTLELTREDRNALKSIVKIDKLTILQAVINGDVENLQMLLDKGENNRDQYVKPLLHIAIRNNKIAIVELLLKYGADVNFKSVGLTPLHVAIHKNRTQIVEYLLKHGAHINSECVISQETCTPLKLAITMGRDILVKLLLQNGARVDSRKNNTLRLAFKENHSIIAAYVYIWSLDLRPNDRSKLLDSLACLEDEYQKIFQSSLKDCQHGKFDNSMMMLRLLAHAAAKTGCIKVVQYFVNHFGFDVNALTVHEPLSRSRQTFLHSAVKDSQTDMIEFLLEIGSDVNVVDDDKKSPIFYAIKYGNATITKRLISCGARMMNDPEFLPNAVGCCHRDLVEILLEHDPDIDINGKDRSGNTSLHNAIENCRRKNSDDKANLDIVKSLLSRGADVNAPGRTDWRPLHFAVRTGCVEVVETLLAHNAEINVTCKSGETPLHKCVSSTSDASTVTIVKLLLANNADVTPKNMAGRTALHHASESGNPEIVELLLEHGADINARSSSGMTPLHVASSSDGKRRQTLEVLLRYGADINAISNCGETPLDYIVKHFRPESVMHVFNKEFIKREVANLYVCEENKKFIDRAYHDLILVKESCEKEIVKMRESKITPTVSFYDILSKNVHDISIYAKYGVFVETLESKEWRNKFPIYCGLILYHFKKGQIREVLLNPSVSSFHFLIGREFLDILTIEIFRYLSDEDLKNLIKARENNCSSELRNDCDATRSSHSSDTSRTRRRKSRKRRREESS